MRSEYNKKIVRRILYYSFKYSGYRVLGYIGPHREKNDD